MREVADELGNTPAVTRSSYVDPRITEAFLRGETIDVAARGEYGPAAEKALLRLLSD
jgi:DNA topoisomerase I